MQYIVLNTVLVCKKSLKLWYILGLFRLIIYPPSKSLSTLDGEVVDPEITVKFEMWYVFKVHGVQP